VIDGRAVEYVVIDDVSVFKYISNFKLVPDEMSEYP
jgi:hypothetical protein